MKHDFEHFLDAFAFAFKHVYVWVQLSLRSNTFYCTQYLRKAMHRYILLAQKLRMLICVQVYFG